MFKIKSDFNLSLLETDKSYIVELIDFYFKTDIKTINKVGEGFYGIVYLVHINKDPNQIILKFFKHSGKHKLEFEQLNLLRKYSLHKVPDVYYIHKYNDDIPFEVLLMEYVSGINASKLPTSHPRSKDFAEELVNNLIHLHNVSNELGFGNSNKMFSNWNTCFKSKIEFIYNRINEKHKDQVSSFVMNVVEQSYNAFDAIFMEKVKKSSLVHSDYNLWNILVDEKTAKITAILDPNDAGWADKEIDLFHLQNANGDRFNLLERYQHKVKLSELYQVKSAFYWFWDDIKHFKNTGWYDEDHFVKFGTNLINKMNEFNIK